MNEFMKNETDIKFEMSHEEIDELIRDFNERKIQINTHDIARIHAHISPNGENCEECRKKVIEAGIITDFNKDIGD